MRNKHLNVLKKFTFDVSKVFKKDTVIQYSPPRSGSTLVYNILRETMPKYHIEKTHTYNDIIANKHAVITYRNPLDSIASLLLIYNITNPHNDLIFEEIDKFKKYYESNLIRLKQDNNVLMLKYENFFNNYDHIYTSLENYFGISIDYNQRNYINNKYSLTSIKDLTNKLSDFSEFDPVTHWHGNHISDYNGSIGYYKHYFNDEQINLLKYYFNRFNREMGYNF